jgi:hypothetical protein
VFLVEPFAFAVELHARAVDEQVQWLVSLDPLRQNLQSATAPAERRVVGDPDLDSEQIRDRSQCTLGLAQRLMQHQVKRQSGLKRPNEPIAPCGIKNRNKLSIP